MPGEKLKLDNAQMHAQAEGIADAVEEYEAFAVNPFETENGYLDKMNTDFTTKLKTMLGDLNDSNPKLVEALDEIKGLTQGITDTLEKVDKDGVEDMSSKGE